MSGGQGHSIFVLYLGQPLACEFIQNIENPKLCSPDEGVLLEVDAPGMVGMAGCPEGRGRHACPGSDGLSLPGSSDQQSIDAHDALNAFVIDEGSPSLEPCRHAPDSVACLLGVDLLDFLYELLVIAFLPLVAQGRALQVQQLAGPSLRQPRLDGLDRRFSL